MGLHQRGQTIRGLPEGAHRLVHGKSISGCSVQPSEVGTASQCSALPVNVCMHADISARNVPVEDGLRVKVGRWAASGVRASRPHFWRF